MGTFSVEDQVLECEQVSRASAEPSFVLRIEYERGSDVNVDRVELDVDSRMEVTENVTAKALDEWHSSAGPAFVRSFDVYERIECRHGGPTDETREKWMIDASKGPDSGGRTEFSEDDEVAVVPIGFSVGDLVAYYVQGPDSSVYGYVAEARVEKTPPWTRGTPGRGERVVDSALLDRGGRSREIPLEWIIGKTEADDIASQVDRPYESG